MSDVEIDNTGRVYYWNPFTGDIAVDGIEDDFTVTMGKSGDWWAIYAPSVGYFVGTQGDGGKYGSVKDATSDGVMDKIRGIVTPNSIKFIE